ncbi:hypothetical protein [Aeromonas phage AerS_266]|nr:hypothetical protein [Aeromonas phage AerS_266]
MNELLIVLFTVFGLIGFGIMGGKKPVKINKDRFVVSLLTLSVLLVGWLYAVIFKYLSSGHF